MNNYGADALIETLICFMKFKKSTTCITWCKSVSLPLFRRFYFYSLIFVELFFLCCTANCNENKNKCTATCSFDVRWIDEMKIYNTIILNWNSWSYFFLQAFRVNCILVYGIWHVTSLILNTTQEKTCLEMWSYLKHCLWYSSEGISTIIIIQIWLPLAYL